MDIRQRIELNFETYGHTVCQHRWAVLVFSLLIAVSLCAGLPSMRIENTFESYLPENNPKKLLFNEFRQQFGSDEQLMIILEPPAIADPVFFNYLREVHLAFEAQLPYLDKITSLINVRRTYSYQSSTTAESQESTLLVEELTRQWPETPADYEQLMRRIADNPLYSNWVISRDGKLAGIVIETDVIETDVIETDASIDSADFEGTSDLNFDDAFSETSSASRNIKSDKNIKSGKSMSQAQIDKLMQALNAILAEHPAPPSTTVYVTGMPAFGKILSDTLTADVTKFILLSIGLIALLLFFLFRTLTGLLAPLLVVGLATATTCGLMGWINMPLTAVTQILPSLILAIGIGDAVHIMAIYYRRLSVGSSREQAISEALGHSGLAVVMTSVTTAAGLATFNVTSLQPTIDLGRAGPFGVLMALFFSLVLLPALLAIIPASNGKLQNRQHKTQRNIDKTLLTFGRLGYNNPRVMLLIAILLWLVSLFGISKLHFSQDDLSWFRDDSPIKIATVLKNERFGGALPFEFVMDTGVENGLHDPQVLKAIDAMQQYAESVQMGPISVGQSFSLADIVKETNKALHDNDPAYYRIPDQRELVSQELLLFENSGSEDLDAVSDATFQRARMMLTVPFVDALYYPRFGEHLYAKFGHILQQHGLHDKVTLTMTGLLTLAGETLGLLFSSMAKSYSLAFVLICICMVLLVGQWRLGIASLIPNITPIAIVLGVMGFLDLALDISSMLLGGILIGIVVDDTIHFVHNFNRYHKQTSDPRIAVEKTLLTTGRAMLITSLVLVVGFLIYTSAQLVNIIVFGLVCALGVMLAFFADAIMMPALVALLDNSAKLPNQKESTQQSTNIHTTGSQPHASTINSAAQNRE